MRLHCGAAQARSLRQTERASFTAWTTRVSNPVRDPSFRPSLSDPSSCGAFATGGPSRIIGFHSYPGRTPRVFRSQARQFSPDAHPLGGWISRRTCPAGYGRFRPNNSGHHSDCRYYRGGWHRSCPVLVRAPPYGVQKRGLYALALGVPLSHWRAV